MHEYFCTSHRDGTRLQVQGCKLCARLLEQLLEVVPITCTHRNPEIWIDRYGSLPWLLLDSTCRLCFTQTNVWMVQASDWIQLAFNHMQWLYRMRHRGIRWDACQLFAYLTRWFSCRRVNSPPPNFSHASKWQPSRLEKPRGLSSLVFIICLYISSLVYIFL